MQVVLNQRKIPHGVVSFLNSVYMNIKVINTERVRKHQLIDKNLQLIGERSGLLILKVLDTKNEITYFSVDSQTINKHFKCDFDLASVPALDKEIWNSIKERLMRF